MKKTEIKKGFYIKEQGETLVLAVSQHTGPYKTVLGALRHLKSMGTWEDKSTIVNEKGKVFANIKQIGGRYYDIKIVKKGS